ncbi:MAG: hypothetical protein K9M99_06840 [Candidatus Cloacimonetes bacterium]|nr:hypothetical protein [Candidatus Cloacimonadota bacterium]
MKIAHDLLGTQEMALSDSHFFIPQQFALIISKLDDPRLFVTIGDRRILIFPVDAWTNYMDRLHKFRDPRLLQQIHHQEMFGAPPSKLDKSHRLKIAAMHYKFLDEAARVKVMGTKEYLQVFTLENYDLIFNETIKDKTAIVSEDKLGYAPVSHTSIVE